MEQNLNTNGYFKGSVEARLDRLEADVKLVLEIQLGVLLAKLDKIEMWLIGVLGTLVIGFAYIIINGK